MAFFLRRSQKGVRLILLALSLLNVIILLLFYLPKPMLEDALVHLLTFSVTAQKYLAKVTLERSRYWLADSTLTHLTSKISILEVVQKDFDKFFYDPRLTLAVYFNELVRLGPSESRYMLPFHWSDWLDMTALNEQKDTTNLKVMTCDRLKRKASLHPDTSYFCKNRDDLSDDDVRNLGYISKEILPPAIVYSHCNHEHLTFNDIRVFMAKLYQLTFLPKPFKVIILGQDRGTYEFDVDQSTGPEQRMAQNGMVERLVTLMRKNTQTLLKQGGTISVNHLKMYNKLRRRVKPLFVTLKEDIHMMHQIVTSLPLLPKDLNLIEQLFSYPPDMIQKQIEQYEKLDKRTALEENFLQGLRACSPFNGDTEPMYFKMATLNIRERKNSCNDFGWHYDWRFFNDALFYEKPGWSKQERVTRTNIILERLLRNWNRFAESKGIVSWIMHGPLLLWYWDGMMFPFDVDIDIQMPIGELVRLSQLYNQTLVVEDPTEGYGRYLIDVGTYIHNRDILTKGNHIDARFIDVDSGIYIDITGLAKSSANLPDEYKKTPIVQKEDSNSEAEVYNDRRKHFYTFDQLLPLHYSQMDGVPLFVPNHIESRLQFEYSKGLVDYEYNGWYFVPKLQLWVTIEKLTKVLREEDIKKDGKQSRELVIAATMSMTDEQALVMLDDDETLMEYYLTHKFTAFHEQEKEFLFDEEGKDNAEALRDPQTRARYNSLTAQIRMGKPLRKCLYEYETFDRIKH